MKICISRCKEYKHRILSLNFVFWCFELAIKGDVLAGSTSNAVHHPGLLEGWFGSHWWNGRVFVLLVTTLGVFVPLASLKRMGTLIFFTN